MKQLIKTAVLCLATVLASLAAYSAIELTTPETIPAKVINAARITRIDAQFYQDGQNLGAMKVLVVWSKGNVTNGVFTVMGEGHADIPAADFAGILLAAETAIPGEYLLGDEAHKTPMDKIFPALVSYLKGKGKM